MALVASQMSQQEGQAEAGRARPLSLEELHEYRRVLLGHGRAPNARCAAQLPKAHTLPPCRHVAASLAGSWQERFAAEQALQRVWPLPGGSAGRLPPLVHKRRRSTSRVCPPWAT